MKKLTLACGVVFSAFFVGCHEKKAPPVVPAHKDADVRDDGATIQFPDTAQAHYFKTEPVRTSNVQAEFSAPARIIATVVKSVENTEQNLVLFDNPDLTANYTAFLQHIININTYKVNLERVRDLASNGAATGKEVIEGQTILANERAAIIEDEAKIKLSGLDPETLIKAKVNSVWLICDIPETQIDNLRLGSTCEVHFSSFPEEVFSGKIEDFGDVVDHITRMVKLRISMSNPKNFLKAGMFATTSFGIKEGRYIAVPRDAFVTVQGKNYVFVKVSEDTFQRREVSTGDQISNKIIVFSGLRENESVAVSGVLQLKGLSFGY